MIVSGLGWWGAGLVILKLGLRPGFIPNDRLWLCPGLDDGAWDLEFWSQSLSFILNDKFLLLLDLDVGTLDWSLRYWSFPNLDDGALESEFWGHSFSFIRNDKLWLFLDLDDGALDLTLWSWAFGPASFLKTNHELLLDLDDRALDLEFWGQSFSFTRNDKLCLFLDLDDEALDLSVMTNYDCFLRPSFIFNDKS